MPRIYYEVKPLVSFLDHPSGSSTFKYSFFAEHNPVMSLLHHIIPASKKKMVTDLPPYEIQNRLNWFLATNARGGPLNGIVLRGGWNSNCFYFEAVQNNPGKTSYQYALVFNGQEFNFHSRWKKAYRNAWIILAAFAFIGFTIEMFDKPLEREDNLQGLAAFPVIYAVLILVTKVQTSNVAIQIKNTLLAREI